MPETTQRILLVDQHRICMSVLSGYYSRLKQAHAVLNRNNTAKLVTIMPQAWNAIDQCLLSVRDFILRCFEALKSSAPLLVDELNHQLLLIHDVGAVRFPGAQSREESMVCVLCAMAEDGLLESV